MAINPGSDIVLEVVKAADPANYKAAAQRLGRLAGAAPLAESFAETLGAARKPAPAPSHMPFDPALAMVRMQNRDALAGQPPSVFEKFEGFILQSFVESMLPKDSEALFGAGTAGEIWRSMLAEGLASQLAKTGGIGIADMLSNTGPESAETAEAAETAERADAAVPTSPNGGAAAPAHGSGGPVCSS